MHKKFFKGGPLFLLLIISGVTFGLNAQQTLPDSLKQQIQNAPNLREKYRVLVKVQDFWIEAHNDIEHYQAVKGMHAIAQELKNDTLLMRTYSKLGGIFEIRSDYKVSLEFFLKSFKIAEDLKDAYNRMEQNYMVSAIYFGIKNYTEAIRYLRRALDVCYSHPNMESMEYSLANIYRNMSSNFNEMNRVDSALKYAQLSNEHCLKLEEMEKQLTQESLFSIFGSVYEKLGDNELAETYYRRSITLSDLIHRSFLKPDIYHNYGQFLLNRNRLDESVKMGLRSLQTAQQDNYKNGIIRAANILRNIYSKMNRLDSAYYYANMEVNYRDTVFNEQNVNQVYDMTWAEQIRQNEIAQQLEQQKQRSKLNIQYSAIALGIISFIILFLLFSQSIIASPKLINILGIIGLLITFEFINLVLHPYIAHITHDSPFLMLLGMVMIAALLVPIHHYLEKKVTHQLVQKNKKLKVSAAKKLLEKYDHENDSDQNKEAQIEAKSE